MDERPTIGILTFLLVLSAFLFFGGYPSELTGYAILGEDVSEQGQNNLTLEEIIIEIEKSEILIKSLEEQNFSTTYLRDVFLDAEKAFEQFKYSKILKNELEATQEERNNARMALSLIDWQNIDSSNILVYTEQIENIQEQILLISDRISLLEPVLNKDISNETKSIFMEAKKSFSEERYSESEDLIKEFKAELEKEEYERTALFAIANSSKTFLEKNWWQSLIGLGMILSLTLIVRKKLIKRRLKKKIERMKVERISINELIKKTQEERFKKNRISQLVYTIRLERYKNRLNEVEHELPVLESRLKKVNRKKAKSK